MYFGSQYGGRNYFLTPSVNPYVGKNNQKFPLIISLTTMGKWVLFLEIEPRISKTISDYFTDFLTVDVSILHLETNIIKTLKSLITKKFKLAFGFFGRDRGWFYKYFKIIYLAYILTQINFWSECFQNMITSLVTRA